MGGYGSGQGWRFSKKDTVEDCWALDVNWMTREGIFDGSGWRSGSIQWSDSYTGRKTSSIGYEVNVPQRWLRLHYRLVRDDESLDYKVPLTTSPLPWGGVRWWFVCALTYNGQYCGRRVGKLYLPPGGRYYGCRHCCDLTYTSCQESRKSDSVWGEMAAGTGMTPGNVRQMWEEDARWERWAKRAAERKEQSLRRRQLRGVIERRGNGETQGLRRAWANEYAGPSADTRAPIG